MSEHWQEIKLGDVIDNYDAKRIPIKESDRTRGPFPYYGASGIIDWIDDFIFDGEYLLIAEDGENLRTRQTPIAFLARGKFWVNNHVHVIRGNSKADTHYLMYALSQSNIEAYLTGSTMPKLTQANLQRIPLLLPPLDEQRAIADILSAFDDKIDLNRRMNATLEATARALFKSWFVDFDPVHAKAAGRQPEGMDAATAALFPDSFEDSALGMIPAGWKVGTLGEVADNPRRSVNPQDMPVGTLYIGLEHMPQKSIALSEWGTADDVESNKSLFYQGEFLFGKLRPYFHKVGVAPIEGICSTDILVLTPITDSWAGYVLFHISSDALVTHTTSLSGGTRMPRTSWRDIARYSVVLPPENIALVFSKMLKPMIQKITANVHESRTLAEIRDALLPKLISGTVRVEVQHART